MVDVNAQDTLFLKYKTRFHEFAMNYKPSYIIGEDTLVVPTYCLPEENLNNYLLLCSKLKDYRLLDYAIIILKKQQKEYFAKCKQDYMLDNPDYSNIGYLEMIRTFLKIDKNDSTYIEPLFSGELLNMIYEKKKKDKP